MSELVCHIDQGPMGFLERSRHYIIVDIVVPIGLLCVVWSETWAQLMMVDNWLVDWLVVGLCHIQ